MSDIEIRRVERDGFAAQTLSFEEGDVSIVLDMHTTQTSYRREARDITRRIQAKRKELDLQVESSIVLSVWIEGMELEDRDWQHITSETRGKSSLNEGEPSEESDKFEVDGTIVHFQIR